ncbi:hypothetical protein [Chryseolinea soli]|uniref:hypothetical protein n=1 Tax=Chryseolinea soli TaxID=2321403 RepID=UPI0013586FEF|nr:hypothetical protein [Chryseolinea soli]
MDKYKTLFDISNRLAQEINIDGVDDNKDDEAEWRRRKLKSDFAKLFDERDKWSPFKRKGRDALHPDEYS